MHGISRVAAGVSYEMDYIVVAVKVAKRCPGLFFNMSTPCRFWPTLTLLKCVSLWDWIWVRLSPSRLPCSPPRAGTSLSRYWGNPVGLSPPSSPPYNVPLTLNPVVRVECVRSRHTFSGLRALQCLQFTQRRNPKPHSGSWGPAFSFTLLLCVLPASCEGLPAASCSLITSTCFPKGLWSLLPLPPDLCSTPVLTSSGLCLDLPFSMKPALSILFSSVSCPPVLLTLLPTLLFSMVLIFQHWQNFLPIMFRANCQSSSARL